MKRTLLCVVVLLLFALEVFAGGGGQQSSQNTAGGMQTLRVWGGNKIWTETGLTTNLSNLYDGTVPSRHWDKFVADLAARNIRLYLTLVMPDQRDTAFQTLLASGRLNEFDWICAGSPDDRTKLTLVRQGRFYPINKAIQEHSSGPARDYYFNREPGKTFMAMDTLDDGNFYWLASTMNSYYKDPSQPKGVAYGGQIRQDWLNKLNLPMPRTLDEFYNTLVAFRQRDANGNGMQDEIAQVVTDNFGTQIAPWFGLGNTLISFIYNKAVSPWYQPNVQAFFQYMNRLYRAGVLNISNDTWDAAVIANRVGFQSGYSSSFGAEMNIILPDGAAPAYFNPIVIDAVPGTKARIYDEELGSNRYFGASLIFIPAESRNIPLAVKFMDYLLTPEYFNLAYYGIEGYSYRLGADGKPQRITVTSPPAPRRDAGLNIPDNMWNAAGILIRWGAMDREVEYQYIVDYGRSQGYENYRKDFYDKFFNDEYPTINGSGSIAFPTEREVDRLAALNPDLTTYSSELVTALIMGTKSLDNWASYMADLRRLGLDELLTINQAQIDRVLKK